LARVGRHIEEDTQVVKEDYERTAGEKGDPCLNDIKTEGYEADAGDDLLTSVSLGIIIHGMDS
jgi:hypothetical protein